MGQTLEYGLIHIRGTLASGKTTTAKLLKHRIAIERPNLPVFTLTGWKESIVVSNGGWEKYLVKLTGISGWGDLGGLKAMLLIGEAQETYWDGDLWTAFFKEISWGIDPYVILFSS